MRALRLLGRAVSLALASIYLCACLLVAGMFDSCINGPGAFDAGPAPDAGAAP